MARCPGLHCPGCGHGASGLILPAAGVVAVAGAGTAIATALADLLTITLAVSSLAVAGMVTLLAVKFRREGLWLVQWNRPEIPAAEPAQALRWPQVRAEVISRQDVPVRPAIKER